MSYDHADMGYTFDDLLLIPRYSEVESRKSPDPSTKIGMTELKIPIIAAPMSTVTEWELAKGMIDLRGHAVIHRYMSPSEQANNFIEVNMQGVGYTPFVAIGATGDFLERAQELSLEGCNKFCIDVANGHTKRCLEAVTALRKRHPDVDIMAGNVATLDGAKRLVDAGANIIRVGIGSGSVCETRVVTGFGVPQLSAIYNCKYAKLSDDIQIVSDGGIRNSGDIVKALAMGADAVMIGGLLAGTKEAPGRTINIDNQLYKQYMGMASEEGRAEWFDEEDSSFVPEGASLLTPYKGELSKVIEKLVSAIKVGMSLGGAMNLIDLRHRAEWIRVTDNGRREGNSNRKFHALR